MKYYERAVKSTYACNGTSKPNITCVLRENFITNNHLCSQFNECIDWFGIAVLHVGFHCFSDDSIVIIPAIEF